MSWSRGEKWNGIASSPVDCAADRGVGIRIATRRRQFAELMSPVVTLPQRALKPVSAPPGGRGPSVTGIAAPIVMAAWLVGLGPLTACGTRPGASAEEGRDLYRQNGCASCHGPEGQGDGPVSAALGSRPRDFRDVAAFKQGTDVTSIAETIATGVIGDRHGVGQPDHAGHHAQSMPRFDHLSESERRSLALYVISLRSLTEKGTPQP